MQYFNYLSDEERQRIFFKEPTSFNRNSPLKMLSYALGATLYMPATRMDICEDILNLKQKGLISVVICLEDAVGDHEVDQALGCLIDNLKKLEVLYREGIICEDSLPLIFVRPRSVDQMDELAALAGELLSVLTGFVFSKFSAVNGNRYFQKLVEINQKLGIKLLAMPILETEDIIFEEHRREALTAVHTIMECHRELVLNVRLGATDFSNLFGLRRSYDMTIYDLAVIRDCIAHILNHFTRHNRDYVISGPVWEYFSSGERVFKTQLREGPFKESYGPMGLKVRSKMLDKYMDGLIHEVFLDKSNGLMGKTIIHPSHLTAVQAMYVVSHEEYIDACSILENCDGIVGVIKSPYANKMNEIKPHLNWAKKTLIRAEIYGVFNDHQTFTSLLDDDCL